MRKSIYLTGLLLLLLAGMVPSIHAQDYSFSQFYALPLMRNPALGGIFTGNIRAQSVYRNQWQSVTVPYRTAALSVEIKLPSEEFTIGVQAVCDIAGDSKLRRIQLLPSLSYHKYVSENIMLTVGVMGGLVSSQFDASALKFDDQFVNGQYSASNPTSQVLKNTGRNYWDFAAGGSILGSVGDVGRWYAGIANYHFTSPAVNFLESTTRLDKKWILNAGFTTPTGELDRVSFYGDYLLQGGNRQFMAGGYFSHDVVQYDEDERVTFSAGCLYRWNDALIPLVKLDWYEWNLGLSYDINISKLKTASQSRGGFELTLGFRGFLNRRNSDVQKVQCFEPL